MRDCRVVRISFLALLCALQTAQADSKPLTAQTLQISLGSFTNESELEIRADGSTSRGTTVDWGDTFGGQDATRFRVDGYWRIAQHHHARFMYTDYSRSNTKTLSETLEWNGNSFPVNASVTAEFGFTIAELAYEYDFSDSPNRDLAFTIGLHNTELHAGIGATLATPSASLSGARENEVRVNAPLPVIGLRGMWLLGYDFYLDAQAQYFALKYENYDGRVTNYRAAVTWQPISWLGIGAGYDAFNINLEVDRKRFHGELDWTYSGPQIFLNVAL